MRDWYSSIKNQKVTWKAYVMDDGSTDNTYGELNKIKDDRLHILRDSHNRGAAYSRWRLMREADPYSIFVFVDLDDWIPNNCLYKLQTPYSKGKLMTMGGYAKSQGGKGSTAVYNNQQINSNQFINSQVFKCPPLRTFHGKCFSWLTPDDFKIDGKWIKTCTDVALSWGVLWHLKAADIQIFRDIMYIYRRRSGTVNSSRFDKSKTYRQLQQKYRGRLNA